MTTNHSNETTAQDSYDIVEVVEKIATNQPLSTEEIQYAIEAVFMPAISGHYRWIENTHIKTAAGAKALAMEEEADQPAPACQTADTPKIGDANGDEDIDETDLQESIRQRSRHRYRNLVYQFAISELWARFADAPALPVESPADDDDGEAAKRINKGIWKTAYRSKYQHGERPTENEVLSYLRMTANNEILDWCAGNGLYALLRRRLRDALDNPAFDVVQATKSQHQTYYFAGKIADPPRDLRYDPDELCTQIDFPPAKGHTKYHVEKLPTATQITEVLQKIFNIYPAPLSVEMMMALIKHGWKLTDIQTKSLEESHEDGGCDGTESRGYVDDRRGDETNGEGDIDKHNGGVAQKPRKPEDNEEFDDQMLRYLQQDESQQQQAAELARRLEQAIEKAAGMPLDVASAKGNADYKLGRMFVEFFLWQSHDVIKGGTRTEYVIDHYAKHTGYGASQEYLRWSKQMVPLVSRITKSAARTNHNLFSDAILILKLKYLHRKPEFIDCGCLIQDEQGTQPHEQL